MHQQCRILEEKLSTGSQEKPVNKYQEVRDRILKKTRSDKLKAVTKALDEFIAEIENGDK